MSTDIIDQAGQSTAAIKAELRVLITRLQTMDLTCNSLGVLVDPGMLGADLDEFRRIIDRIEARRVHTQWPTWAEYSEV